MAFMMIGSMSLADASAATNNKNTDYQAYAAALDKTTYTGSPQA